MYRIFIWILRISEMRNLTLDVRSETFSQTGVISEIFGVAKSVVRSAGVSNEGYCLLKKNTYQTYF